MKHIQKIKNSLVVGALLGMFFFQGFGGVDQVYAADPVPAAGANVTDPSKAVPCGGEGQLKCEVTKKLEQTLGPELANVFAAAAITVSLILKYCYVLLMPLLAIIGKFMSNDWVTGNVFNVDVMIEVAWSYIRNLVNIAMMFYLLYIAGSNILFGYFGRVPKDAQGIPNQLRQVALVLILVNFSMLFCRTIINISGVVTTGAFGIAKQSGPIFEQNTNGYNPFIWPDNLGTKTTATEGNATVNGNITAYGGSAGGDSVYALECIHKNYAVSLKSFDLSGNGGNIVIANPVLDSAGNYSKAWYHDYRILIRKSELYAEDQKVWNEKVKALKSNAAGTEGYIPSEQTFVDKNLGVENQNSSNGLNDYPYYSDCMTDWNDLYFSSRNAMFLFAFNLMKIGEYENGLGNISSFTDLLSRVVISVVYLFVFLAIIVALAVAMVLRGIVLWFLMVMSPIWLTLEVLGKKDLGAFKGKIGTVASFVQLAFMPAVLGFILSIMFLMINYLKYIGKLEGSEQGLISLGGLSLYFDANNPIIGGFNSLFEMMIAIITIVAVWFAVTTAFKFGFEDKGFIQKMYEPTVGRILKTAGSIGKFVATAPLKAPIIPVGNGQKLSLAGAADLPDRMMRAKMAPFMDNDQKVLERMTGSIRMDPTKAAALQHKFTDSGLVSTKDKFQEHMTVLNPSTDVKDRKTSAGFIKALLDRGSATGTTDLSFNIEGKPVTIGKLVANELYRDYSAKNTATGGATEIQLKRVIKGLDNPHDPTITEADWKAAESIMKKASTDTTSEAFKQINDDGTIMLGSEKIKRTKHDTPSRYATTRYTTDPHAGKNLKEDYDRLFVGGATPLQLSLFVANPELKKALDALYADLASKRGKTRPDIADLAVVLGINPATDTDKMNQLKNFFALS